MANTYKLKTGYKRCTRKQLVNIIKADIKLLYMVANAPEWKTFNGKTRIQAGRAIKKHLKGVAQFLRASTIKELDQRYKTITTQVARRLGVSPSQVANSPVARRLRAKRRQIATAVKISVLTALVRNFKTSSFKAPRTVGGYKVGKRSTYRRTRRTYGRKGRRTTTSVTRSKVVAGKYRTEAKKLKREIKSLKTRNTTLRRQVAKFRTEVAKMQRHYSTLNRTPRWKVISGGNVGKDVSNIVRISNALNSVMGQRKFG